ncbi:MAG: site-specific tyrosine recombinase/integron integrase [Planctomycetota bacterium]|jgi:site-specific recombinase XerD
MHAAEFQKTRHTYNDGKPYLPARGRRAERQPVEQWTAISHAILDLTTEPSVDDFLRSVRRELKIRGYSQKSQKSYLSVLRSFLTWYRHSLCEVTPDDVRDYLELLVDGGASTSHLSVSLSAIRTAFDKFCGLDCTRGIVTPRRRHKLPVVLSEVEVRKLLEAATSLRDKLLLGLMYAAGLRVSEVVRLMWEDLDFERNTILVRQGKGHKDRLVMLPESFQPVLSKFSELNAHRGYLFPSEGRRSGRHLSPRTAQRAMQTAVELAGITKPATCHSLRHSFATHMLEHGTDVRFIQKLLGHARLETTTIYAKVAVHKAGEIESPLDRIAGVQQQGRPSAIPEKPSVGTLRMSVESAVSDEEGMRTAVCHVEIVQATQSLDLPGIMLRESRPGWLALDVPPLELWESTLSQLTRPQRERICEPAFYDLLHRELSRRYLTSG